MGLCLWNNILTAWMKRWGEEWEWVWSVVDWLGGRKWELARGVAECTEILTDKHREDVHFLMHVRTNDKHTPEACAYEKCFLKKGMFCFSDRESHFNDSRLERGITKNTHWHVCELRLPQQKNVATPYLVQTSTSRQAFMNPSGNVLLDCVVGASSDLFTPSISLRLSSQIEIQKASHISSLLFLV